MDICLKFCQKRLASLRDGLAGVVYPVRAFVLYRTLIAIAAMAWAFGVLLDVTTWYGEAGVLPSGIAATLVEYEEIPRWQSWSPLWWTDALPAYYAWLIGILLAMGAIAVGRGGRLAVTFGLLLVIGWSHRSAWLSGPVEPALVSFLGFLLIDPGANYSVLELMRRRSGGDPCWLTQRQSLVVRAARIHWWILVAAGLLNQLAGIVWWSGDGAWWLAASGHSWWLKIDFLFDHPLVTNAITHGIVLVQILALWLLACRSTRRAGIVFAIASCLAIAVLADQLAYGLLLLSALGAYYGSSQPVGGAKGS